MSDTPSRLDGNVTAGALATVFSFEVTTARCTWAACRKTAVLAGLHVYVDAPGIVVRCASCEAVVLRYAEPRVAPGSICVGPPLFKFPPKRSADRQRPRRRPTVSRVGSDRRDACA
jgi:hypothetical protein